MILGCAFPEGEQGMNVARSVTVGIESLHSDNVDANDVPVITSYSIHYTKLYDTAGYHASLMYGGHVAFAESA